MAKTLLPVGHEALKIPFCEVSATRGVKPPTYTSRESLGSSTIDNFLSSNTNNILQGDSFEILPRLPALSAELILTDIPYGVVNRKSAGIRQFDKGAADVADDIDLELLVSEFDRICRGSMYVFCGTEQVSELRRLMVERGMTTRLCIWEKTNPSPVNGRHLWLSGVETCVFGRKKGAIFNEHCKNTVWRFPNGRSKIHPTEKPAAMFEYLIETSSNRGDFVIDPFAGSGTTAAACIASGRRFLCIERDAGFYASACERIGIAPATSAIREETDREAEYAAEIVA